MFLSYYQLKAKPFPITTDSRFLWLGDKHKDAFATLKYGIWDNKGFLLLTGEVGAGKTTLLNALIKSLDKRVIVARIADPALSELDFYRLVARAFHFKNIPKNKGDFLHSCTLFLNQAYKAGKKVLLIVDEAQRISNELLEDIRLLSNIEREDSKLINIFFVGQSEFNEILLDYRNRAIRQRITVNYNLETLKLHEVAAYIQYRLNVAGTEQKLFTPGAVEEIFHFSGGVPRLINIICDRALLTGYVADKRRIDADIIIECAEELQITPPASIADKEKRSAETATSGSAEKETGRGENVDKPDDKKKGSGAGAGRVRKESTRVHLLYLILIFLLLILIGFLSFGSGGLGQHILTFLGNISITF